MSSQKKTIAYFATTVIVHRAFWLLPSLQKLLSLSLCGFIVASYTDSYHTAGHIRSRYGGTLSAGFKRGSIVKHPKYGLCYVGGWQESPTKKDPDRKTISLHNLETGKRLTQNANPADIQFFSYNSWRFMAVKTA